MRPPRATLFPYTTLFRPERLLGPDEVLGEGPPEPAEASVDRLAREPRQRRRDGAPRPPGERGRDRAAPDEVALVDLDEQVEGAAAERLREAVLVVRGVGAPARGRPPRGGGARGPDLRAPAFLAEARQEIPREESPLRVAEESADDLVEGATRHDRAQIRGCLLVGPVVAGLLRVRRIADDGFQDQVTG